MNGPQHYREAEGVLRLIAEGQAADLSDQDRAATLAIAQVHATLALVAATVDVIQTVRDIRDEEAWVEVIR